jgi:hypothetical protein
MKTLKRNTLFSTLLLLGTATVAFAQTAITTAPVAQVAADRNLSLFNTVSPTLPTPVQGFGYAYNHKQINDADLTSKEVSKEIGIPKNGDIYIENTSRAIVVKTWDQPKVKITTTVHYEGESKLTDEEWLDKVNLSMKVLGSSVKIRSTNLNAASYYSFNNSSSSLNFNGNGIAVYDGNGQNIGSRGNIKRIIIITVPVGSKLDIESKYADVTLPAHIGDVTVDIANGYLEAENLNKLTLRHARYANINVGDVKFAEIELNNGRFSAKNIDDLDIESIASTVEIAYAKKVVMVSSNDEYELEEADQVRGKKDFGSLRITKLNSSFEIKGSSADVKIRNLGPLVSLIKIDDKFANIRIPLQKTKNYAVDFTGAYSSVFGHFDKKNVPDTALSSITSVGTLTNMTVTGHITPARYKTPSGDIITISDVTLAPAVANNKTEPKITSTGRLSNMTVTGVLTSGSGNREKLSPITSLGTLTNLRVEGKEVATTIPANNVSGRIAYGTIEGGTFNANPSTIYRGGQLSQIAQASNINGGMLRSFPGNNDTPSRFTASGGDGKGLKIDIKCPNCTVDFK